MTEAYFIFPRPPNPEFVISVILWYHVCVVFVEVWRMSTDGSFAKGCADIQVA